MVDKSIESLPNEIFRYIFKFFDYGEKLQALTTCRRFYDVLQMEDINHLRFTDCIIKQKTTPYSTFCQSKQSKRKFTRMSLNYIYFDFNNLTDIKTFFSKVGKNVVHLTIESEFPIDKLPSIISFIPNLDKLELFDATWLACLQGPFPTSCKTLVIPGLSHNHEFSCINKIPQLECIKREFVNLYNFTTHIPENFSKPTTKLTDTLYKLDVHSNIVVDVNYLSDKSISFKHVTHLTCSGSSKEFQLIAEHFINLYSLSFDVTMKNKLSLCFFGHETLDRLRMIKTLILIETNYYDQNTLCDDCFTSFLNSFINVSALTIHTRFKAIHIKQLFGKWNKLRKFHVWNYSEEILFGQTLGSSINELEIFSFQNIVEENMEAFQIFEVINLKKLSISTNLNQEVKNNILTKCHNLREFQYKNSNYVIDDSTIIHLLKSWPKLKLLELNCPAQLTHLTWDMLKANNQHMEYIKVHSNVDLHSSFALFKYLTKLKKFESKNGTISRLEYLRYSKKELQSKFDSFSDEADKEWCWIANHGWGWWTKDEIKMNQIENKFKLPEIKKQ